MINQKNIFNNDEEQILNKIDFSDKSEKNHNQKFFNQESELGYNDEYQNNNISHKTTINNYPLLHDQHNIINSDDQLKIRDDLFFDEIEKILYNTGKVNNEINLFDQNLYESQLNKLCEYYQTPNDKDDDEINQKHTIKAKRHNNIVETSKKLDFQVYDFYDDCIKMFNEGRNSKFNSISKQTPYENSTDNRLYVRRDIQKEFFESKITCVHTESKCIVIIREAAEGLIPRVKRRLNDKEKSMIRPGSIYVYTESESGIRRWTDKLEWTPSRICGPFLVYKNLNGNYYKKTFTHFFCNEMYHLIIYSTYEDEKTRNCCLRYLN